MLAQPSDRSARPSSRAARRRTSARAFGSGQSRTTTGKACDSHARHSRNLSGRLASGWVRAVCRSVCELAPAGSPAGLSTRVPAGLSARVLRRRTRGRRSSRTSPAGRPVHVLVEVCPRPRAPTPSGSIPLDVDGLAEHLGSSRRHLAQGDESRPPSSYDAPMWRSSTRTLAGAGGHVGEVDQAVLAGRRRTAPRPPQAQARAAPAAGCPGRRTAGGWSSPDPDLRTMSSACALARWCGIAGTYGEATEW